MSSAQGKSPSATHDQLLIAAIKHDDVREVKVLLAEGVNPNTHELRSWKYIPLDQMPTEVRSSKRRTGQQPPSALFIALGLWSMDDPQFDKAKRTASPAVVKALIEAGAHVNERDPDSLSTPLMEAVREEDAATVKLLLRKGARVDAPAMKGGVTALMLAVFLFDRNRAEVVKILLDHSADPNAMTGHGDRPLTMVRRAEYIPLLIKYGANINAKDKQGLMVLARVKKEQSAYFPASDDVVQALRSNGAKE